MNETSTRPRTMPDETFPRWASGTWFRPADEKVHARANGGADVVDVCANCGLDFMEHVNAMCPK